MQEGETAILVSDRRPEHCRCRRIPGAQHLRVYRQLHCVHFDLIVQQSGQHLLPFCNHLQQEPDQVFGSELLRSRTHNNPRDVWWQNVEFPSKSDPMRKKLIHYFFTGSRNVSAAEIEEMEALLKSPPFQKEFCDYMIHSSKTSSC